MLAGVGKPYDDFFRNHRDGRPVHLNRDVYFPFFNRVADAVHAVRDDWLIFAERGIEVRPFDDTMLISYALDAAATTDGHGMDWLSEHWLGHDTIHFADVAGSGKNFIGFARVAIDKATEYAAEDVDVTLRLWQALKSRLPAERGEVDRLGIIDKERRMRIADIENGG